MACCKSSLYTGVGMEMTASPNAPEPIEGRAAVTAVCEIAGGVGHSRSTVLDASRQC
jgi:hypothetical protein